MEAVGEPQDSEPCVDGAHRTRVFVRILLEVLHEAASDCAFQHRGVSAGDSVHQLGLRACRAPETRGLRQDLRRRVLAAHADGVAARPAAEVDVGARGRGGGE